MRIPILLFVFIFALPLFSQEYVRSDNAIKEGIYIDYTDFLENRPRQVKLVKKGSVILLWDELQMKEVLLDPQKVWGYSMNNQIYISYENAFWKLINQGRLNHFSAIVIQHYQSYDSFGFMVNRSSKVLTHLFFDKEDGEIKLLNKGNFEEYFQEDQLLEKHYKKLNGSRIERLILVLQAFNERHPD